MILKMNMKSYNVKKDMFMLVFEVRGLGPECSAHTQGMAHVHSWLLFPPSLNAKSISFDSQNGGLKLSRAAASSALF